MKGVTAQNVIDNEILSNNNDGNNVNDEDNDSNKNSNTNVNDDSSNLNEFVAKPLVHVSIEGTEINDKIVGKCKYEDKGLIPKPIPDKGPLFSNFQIPDNQDNDFKSFVSKDEAIFDNKNLSFEKFLSKFTDIDIPIS